MRKNARLFVVSFFVMLFSMLNSVSVKAGSKYGDINYGTVYNEYGLVLSAVEVKEENNEQGGYFVVVLNIYNGTGRDLELETFGGLVNGHSVTAFGYANVDSYESAQISLKFYLCGYVDSIGDEYVGFDDYNITEVEHIGLNLFNWNCWINDSEVERFGPIDITFKKHEHKYDDGKVITTATCNSTGVMQYTCTSCGNTKEESLPQLEHEWDAGKIAKKPTPEEEGEMLFTCKNCKTTRTEPISNEEQKKQKAAADAVVKKLEKIPEIKKLTAKDNVLVDDAYKAYKALSKAEKAYLPSGTFAKIEKFQKQIKILKAEAADKNSVKNREEEILKWKSDKDLIKSTYVPLMIKATTSTQTSITVGWSKVDGASGYIVYGNMSGSAYKMKYLTTTTKTKYTVKSIGEKSLKKGKYYKFVVLAYKTVNGYKKCKGTSNIIHVATTGGSVTNVKKIKLKESAKTLKKNKTWTVETTTVKKDAKKTLKKYFGIRYASSDKSIASVDSKGKVTAKRKGTAKIYAYAQNGIVSTAEVTVK